MAVLRKNIGNNSLYVPHQGIERLGLLTCYQPLLLLPRYHLRLHSSVFFRASRAPIRAVLSFQKPALALEVRSATAVNATGLDRGLDARAPERASSAA